MPLCAHIMYTITNYCQLISAHVCVCVHVHAYVCVHIFVFVRVCVNIDLIDGTTNIHHDYFDRISLINILSISMIMCVSNF